MECKQWYRKYRFFLFFTASLMGSVVYSAPLGAPPVLDGSQMVRPDTTPVADGNPSNKVRETYYKDVHKEIPEGREIGSYYASWGVHSGRDYGPHQVPVERLTHVYVGFGGICGDNPTAYNNGGGLRDFLSESVRRFRKWQLLFKPDQKPEKWRSLFY